MGGRTGKGLGNKQPWGKQELQPKSLRETTGDEWSLALAGFKRIVITLASVLTTSHCEDDTYGTTAVTQDNIFNSGHRGWWDAQQLRAIPALAKNLSSILSTHLAAPNWSYSSSSRRLDALFWPLWEPTHRVYSKTYIIFYLNHLKKKKEVPESGFKS